MASAKFTVCILFALAGLLERPGRIHLIMGARKEDHSALVGPGGPRAGEGREPS